MSFIMKDKLIIQLGTSTRWTSALTVLGLIMRRNKSRGPTSWDRKNKKANHHCRAFPSVHFINLYGWASSDSYTGWLLASAVSVV